jgi:hypothetical protein
MGNLLDVDLQNLHRLGAGLAGHADAIKALKITATVRMPGSPVQGVADQAGAAVVEAFRVIGGNITRMSDACTHAARTYEEADRVFVTQRQQYASGR